MKNMIKIFIALVVLSLSLTFYSCEDDISPLNESSIQQAAVLTTQGTATGTNFNKFDVPGSNLTVTVAFRDFGNNDSMESVDMLVKFVDATPDALGNTLKVPEAPLTTLSPDDFTVGDSGYPENTFTLNGSAALTALGITEDDIDGGDQLILRYALNLSDGRTFSSDNVGVSVATTSHLTPFRYAANIVCFNIFEAGDWILNMNDSYGDGWDGAFLTANINGVETAYTVNGGFGEVATISLPANAQFTLVYTSGSFEGEHSYTLTDPSGNIVVVDGPGPEAGVELLNSCD